MKEYKSKDGSTYIIDGNVKLLKSPSSKYIKKYTKTEDEINIEKNNKILSEIKKTDTELIDLIEDIAIWAESLGFEIPSIKKTLIENRQNKRDNLI